MRKLFIMLVSISVVLSMYSCNDEDKADTTTGESGIIGGHGYVDLGLSVMWATCNVGAVKPEGYGDYYAWGEVSPWKEYTDDNYRYDLPYCNSNNVLYPKYDAATTNWGNYWRMPTRTELDELDNGCTWSYVDNYNGTNVAGYFGTSKLNGNTIFLPAAGMWEHDYKTNSTIGRNGYYRASDFLGKNVESTLGVWGLKFVPGLMDWDDQGRSDGIVVRAVSSLKQIEIQDNVVTLDEAETQKQGVTVNGKVGGYTYVDLGLPSGKKWATYNVGASMPEEYGNYYAWGEVTTKDKYTIDNYKFFNGYDQVTGKMQLTKYVRYSLHGNFDNKLTLDASDDAASVNWGNGWHMPSQKDIEEMIDGCTWKRKDNLNGSKVIGWIGYSRYNDMYIYLPAGGREYDNVPNTHMMTIYWSSELLKQNNQIYDDLKAGVMIQHNGVMEMTDWGRHEGCPIRAVVE